MEEKFEFIITHGNQIKNIDQISFYQKLIANSHSLRCVKFYKSKQSLNEYCLKCPATLFPALATALDQLGIGYQKSQKMTHYFATNLPTSIDTSCLEILFGESFQGAKLTRLVKNERCGFLLIPDETVANHQTLIIASKNQDGTPVELPSCPLIYLRPRRKHASHSNTKNTNSHKILLSNSSQMRPAWERKSQKGKISNFNSSIEQRLAHLEESNLKQNEKIKRLEENQNQTNKVLTALTESINKLVLTVQNNQTQNSQPNQNQHLKRSFSSPEPESFYDEQSYDNDENLEPEFSPISKPLAKPVPKRRKIPTMSDTPELEDTKSKQNIPPHEQSENTKKLRANLDKMMTDLMAAPPFKPK